MLKESDKVGAVMVVGSGIAGIQASLDLANSGMKVFLVEREISIGGVMAQLDKTFPTNDCSACILSPKLVEVGRHPNVEIMTGRTVEAVEGEAGRFRVRMTKAPRYRKPGQVHRLRGLRQCLPRLRSLRFQRKSQYPQGHLPPLSAGHSLRFRDRQAGDLPLQGGLSHPHQRPGVRGPDRGGKVQGSPETDQKR